MWCSAEMLGGGSVSEVVLNDRRSSDRQRGFRNAWTVLFGKDYSCCFVSRAKRQLAEGRPTGRPFSTLGAVTLQKRDPRLGTADKHKAAPVEGRSQEQEPRVTLARVAARGLRKTVGVVNDRLDLLDAS